MPSVSPVVRRQVLPLIYIILNHWGHFDPQLDPTKVLTYDPKEIENDGLIDPDPPHDTLNSIAININDQLPPNGFPLKSPVTGNQLSKCDTVGDVVDSVCANLLNQNLPI